MSRPSVFSLFVVSLLGLSALIPVTASAAEPTAVALPSGYASEIVVSPVDGTVIVAGASTGGLLAFDADGSSMRTIAGSKPGRDLEVVGDTLYSGACNDGLVQEFDLATMTLTREIALVNPDWQCEFAIAAGRLWFVRGNTWSSSVYTMGIDVPLAEEPALTGLTDRPRLNSIPSDPDAVLAGEQSYSASEVALLRWEEGAVVVQARKNLAGGSMTFLADGSQAIVGSRTVMLPTLDLSLEYPNIGPGYPALAADGSHVAIGRTQWYDYDIATFRRGSTTHLDTLELDEVVRPDGTRGRSVALSGLAVSLDEQRLFVLAEDDDAGFLYIYPEPFATSSSLSIDDPGTAMPLDQPWQVTGMLDASGNPDVHAGRQVDVVARSSTGAEVVLGTTFTSSTGAWAVDVEPGTLPAGGSWTIVASAPAWLDWPASTSERVVEVVRHPVVTLTAEPAIVDPAVGSTLVVAEVVGVDPGATVVLERVLGDGTWGRMATYTTDGAGRAFGEVAVTSDSRMRAVVEARGDEWVGATSAPIDVLVREPSSLTLAGPAGDVTRGQPARFSATFGAGAGVAVSLHRVASDGSRSRVATSLTDDGGIASFELYPEGSGTWVARFGGDATRAATWSEMVEVTVVEPPPTGLEMDISLSSSAVTFGSAVTVTASTPVAGMQVDLRGTSTDGVLVVGPATQVTDAAGAAAWTFYPRESLVLRAVARWSDGSVVGISGARGLTLRPRVLSTLSGRSRGVPTYRFRASCVLWHRFCPGARVRLVPNSRGVRAAAVVQRRYGRQWRTVSVRRSMTNRYGRTSAPVRYRAARHGYNVYRVRWITAATATTGASRSRWHFFRVLR